MAEALEVKDEMFVRSVQTHTTNVHKVTLENMKEELQDVDGLITDVPDICLVTSYADCVPLYFVDPAHRAIGLSHSGWRGTVGKIGQETIDQFKEAFDSKHWDDLFYQKENKKYQLNLWKANEIIMLEAGVKRENIAVTNVCTSCNSDVLYSHRASKGQRGGLAAFMALK